MSSSNLPETFYVLNSIRFFCLEFEIFQWGHPISSSAAKRWRCGHLGSKMLSAPSFSHEWKQLIRSPYCVIDSSVKQVRNRRKNQAIFGGTCPQNAQLFEPRRYFLCSWPFLDDLAHVFVYPFLYKWSWEWSFQKYKRICVMDNETLGISSFWPRVFADAVLGTAYLLLLLLFLENVFQFHEKSGHLLHC